MVQANTHRPATRYVLQAYNALNAAKCDCGRGSGPGPDPASGGSLWRYHRHLAGFKGPASQRGRGEAARKSEGEQNGKEKGEIEQGGRGRGGEGIWFG